MRSTGRVPPRRCHLVAAGVPVGTITSDAVSAYLRGAVLTLAGHATRPPRSAPRHRAQPTGFVGAAEALVRTVAHVPARADIARLAATGITTDPSVEPGHWSLLGGTEGGLAQLRTLERLGVKPSDVAELDAAAERSPESGPGAQWREVVAAAADDALALHRAMDDVGVPAVRVVVTGGWRHSAEVMRAKATRFGRLDVSDVDEAGALGAATLAARACGAIGVGDHLGRP